MQQNLIDALCPVVWLAGDAMTVAHMPAIPVKRPFQDDILDFLNEISRYLMRDSRSKGYSDVFTLAFWLRKSSTMKLREKFGYDRNMCLRLGRGVIFHIAPSNVPVNFAYSLAAGLLTGNSNIVRVPSKYFAQVTIITEALHKALDVIPEMRPYIALIQYEHDKTVNDSLSYIADTRIIWGGDATVTELRKSPLQPRSIEVAFSDRYSIAVIDAEVYLSIGNKAAVAQDFYNDTFFSDQNACTSPRLVAWLGNNRIEAKRLFWANLHAVVERKYQFQPIQGVNKLVSGCLAAIQWPDARIEPHNDNLIQRVWVPKITNDLMELKDNSGYFFEYDCDDILELRPLCDDKRCQTVALLGDKSILCPLLESAPRGIDRVVPIGKTMDFDLIWDGYELPVVLTRSISGI